MSKRNNLWWIWTICNVVLLGLFVLSLFSDVWEAFLFILALSLISQRIFKKSLNK